MSTERRMRVIRLIEMIEREPELAKELGISVKQKINGEEFKGDTKWQGERSEAIAR